MENTKAADARISARERALSLLNNMTAGIVFAALAGVGIFGAISEITIPGVSASSSTATSATSSSASTSSSSGLQSSSGTVSTSSSSPVAVSGGS